MRYGIFSDVHSNLEAFTVVFDYYKKENIDKFIFLGDIVGYGADPNRVISLLRELGPVCLGGNHDWAAIAKFDIDYFNRCAKEALLWTQKKLKMEDIKYLETFKLVYNEGRFICVHGSPHEPEKFHYVFDVNDARLNFSFFDTRICFLGHSHVCEVYSLRDGQIRRSKDYSFEILPQEKYIINVGSVGQPRDRDWRACVCIYDSDKDVVTFKRLEYNVKEAANKILSAGLPSILAKRLYAGY
ncbi:MAG: metallophosphoesterase family protein [Candidatus Omnitrophota bacterium]|nr:MAG: metallophosphoesterase family protein [Candidatus Omnitrophota bacterium]